MRRLSINRVLYAGLALVASLSIACGDEPAQPATPGIQPEIINAVDNFQFQVTAVENYSGTLRYNWTNTGQEANVDQSCAVTAGTVTLTLIDDTGVEVYSHDLSQGGSFASAAGTSGSWRIRVSMSNVSGNLNFRCDKRTP
jgi:hypothetical protein